MAKSWNWSFVSGAMNQRLSSSRFCCSALSSAVVSIGSAGVVLLSAFAGSAGLGSVLAASVLGGSVLAGSVFGGSVTVSFFTAGAAGASSAREMTVSFTAGVVSWSPRYRNMVSWVVGGSVSLVITVCSLAWPVVSAAGRCEPAACRPEFCGRAVVRASREQPIKPIITFFMGLFLKVHFQRQLHAVSVDTGCADGGNIYVV